MIKWTDDGRNSLSLEMDLVTVLYQAYKVKMQDSFV